MGELELYLGERPSPVRTRHVILKHLSRASCGYLALRERMIEEGRYAQQLAHQNFLPYLDAQEDDSGFTLVYEAPRGVEISRAVTELAKRGDALPFGLIAHIGREVARATAYAHREHSMVLRELRPENVFITKEGRILIATYSLDLGYSEHQPNGRTAVHLAPECLTRHDYSMSSDVYALGIMLFTLLAGRPPADVPLRLEELEDEGVPDTMIAIVGRATHPAKGERFRDVLLLAARLESWLVAQGITFTQQNVGAFFARNLGPRSDS
jgi:serine/threonine-protein kinase